MRVITLDTDSLFGIISQDVDLRGVSDDLLILMSGIVNHELYLCSPATTLN